MFTIMSIKMFIFSNNYSKVNSMNPVPHRVDIFYLMISLFS